MNFSIFEHNALTFLARKIGLQASANAKTNFDAEQTFLIQTSLVKQ